MKMFEKFGKKGKKEKRKKNYKMLYIYIMTDRMLSIVDLTGDEPVIIYRPETAQETRRNTRRPLGEITPVEISQAMNMDEPISRNRRRRRRIVDETPENIENVPPQTGRGMKSGNPWIQHVKNFAKAKGIPYWQALKSPETKSSYQKLSAGKGVKGKGINISRAFRNLGKKIAKPFEIGGVNPFEAGYKFGYSTVGPALLGKK
jgi:hypothetical protein